MARHRDGDDELEVIVENDAGVVDGPALPGRSGRREPRGRRTIALVAVIGLVGAGLGGVVGWQLHRTRPAPAAQELVVAPAETATTVAEQGPPPMPPTYDMGAAGHGGPYGAGDLELIGRRTTPEGVTIRAYLGSDPFECPDGLWCPPAECHAGAGVMSAVSTDLMVGQGGSAKRPDVIAPPVYVAGWGSAGQAEGDPVVFVTVRVPAEATEVALLSHDSARDVAAPSSGWAVLATRWTDRDPVHVGEDSGYESRSPDVAGLVVVASAGEKELDRLPVGQEGGWYGPLPGHCEPPGPPLPAPGEQPADPDPAREAIRAIYAQAWNHTSTRAEKLDAIHTPVGVERAMEQAAASYGQAVGSTIVEVGDIVFTSSTQAQLHFRLTYTGAPSLGHRVGGAVLVDGRWLVLRGTYCEVLSMAGASCSAT